MLDSETYENLYEAKSSNNNLQHSKGGCNFIPLIQFRDSLLD